MKITIQDNLFTYIMPLYFIITRRYPDSASRKEIHWVETDSGTQSLDLSLCGRLLAVWHWASSILQTLILLFFKISSSWGLFALDNEIYVLGLA